MRNILFILFAFILSVILSSCNNPLDKTYSSQSYINDIEAIRESDKVSYEDIELLTKYIALARIAGSDLNGKTYEEILDKIKQVRKTNADKTDQINFEKEAARERLGTYLKVSLSDKIFSKVNNKDGFTYTVIFKNTSQKNIKMVVGSISLNDLLDREIKNIPIVLDETIHAGETVKKQYTDNYNQDSENDKRIRSKDIIDLKIVWNPVKIIFEDKTIAE